MQSESRSQLSPPADTPDGAAQAPLPDDAPRLQVLRSLHLADAPPDPSFEPIVRLARGLTGRAVALVTLIEESEALHVARVGLEQPRSPRTEAFCNQAIQQAGFFEVADLRADPRFARMASVDRPDGWRHYAAVPLLLDGLALGTLCVLDRQVGPLAPGVRQQLCELAEIAQDQLRQRRHRLALEEQAERLSDLARAAGDWAWELDAELRLSWISGDLQVVTGLDPADCLGQRPAAEALVDGAGHVLAQGGTLTDILSERKAFSRVVSRLQCPRGTLLISRSAMPVYDARGRFRGYRGAARDVTAGLEREGLLRDKSAVESASRARSAFLSRVSHELRTPLNAILGFAQLMSLDADHPLAVVQSQRLDGVQRASRHLLELVDDVLDIVRLEQGGRRMAVLPLGLNGPVDLAVAAQRDSARARGISLGVRLPEGLQVLADPQALEQVLAQLLSNAVKYNRQGGHVEVSAQRQGGRVHLNVSDSGPGLAPDELDSLFQPFQRPGAERHRVDGSGLGLVLVRELVRAMGGQVGAHSEPGVGSTFSVELPAPAEQRPSPEASRAESSARTVLYIEDEPLNVLLMQEVFKARPAWTLHVARDGQEGVQAARTLAPDLALIDMNLPDFNGLEVLRQLRAEASTRPLRCIALSADAMHEQVSAALAAGFDDYWTKPIDLTRLLGAVAAALDAGPSRKG